MSYLRRSDVEIPCEYPGKAGHLERIHGIVTFAGKKMLQIVHVVQEGQGLYR